MNQKLIPYVLFDMAPVGSLQVYSMRTAENTAPIDNYYWKDAGSPQGFGPFVSLHECMHHYKAIAQFFKTNANGMRAIQGYTPPKDNVVYVDFKGKKRIS